MTLPPPSTPPRPAGQLQERFADHRSLFSEGTSYRSALRAQVRGG